MNKTDKENLHKEIDLIQECIKRMASNSFLLKGWTISLVAVVLALSEKNVSPYFLGLVILVPLMSFWYLDAFFLYTEKLYRKMYEWVIAERPKSNNNKMYDLNPHRFKNELKVRRWNKCNQKMEDTDKNESVWSVMWSITLRCFYFIPLVLVILILVILFFNQRSKDTTSQYLNCSEKAKHAIETTPHGTANLKLPHSVNHHPKIVTPSKKKETGSSNDATKPSIEKTPEDKSDNRVSEH